MLERNFVSRSVVSRLGVSLVYVREPRLSPCGQDAERFLPALRYAPADRVRPYSVCFTADATRVNMSELAALLKRLDDPELPYPEALEIDFCFHRKLLDMVGNPLMKNLMEVIYEFVLTQMVRTTPSQRQNTNVRKLHKAILSAVRKRDPDAAATAMRHHMQAVLDRLVGK